MLEIKKVGGYPGVGVMSWEMGLIPISYGPRSKSPALHSIMVVLIYRTKKKEGL